MRQVAGEDRWAITYGGRDAPVFNGVAVGDIACFRVYYLGSTYLLGLPGHLWLGRPGLISRIGLNSIANRYLVELFIKQER